MSLRTTLRRAAGLLVELPAEELPPEPPFEGSATDKLWAELEKSSQNTPPAPPSTAPSASAVPFAAPASLPVGAVVATKSVEQIVRDQSGPNLDQIQLAPDALAGVSGENGAVHFSEIYQAANLPAVPFTAEQVLEMVAALPAEIPLESRRQMLKVSINSMGKSIGATPENIVADASRKLAALAAYTDHLAETTTEYTRLSEQKIASLQAEVEKIRQSVGAAQQRQAHETQLCTTEAHRLDDVLEFFSLDVAPSQYAPGQTTPR